MINDRSYFTLRLCKTDMHTPRMAHTLQIQFEMAIVSLFEIRFDVAQPI